MKAGLLVSFSGSGAWPEKKSSVRTVCTYSVHPGFLGKFCEACQLPCERCLPLTTLCVDNDDNKVMKALSSLLVYRNYPYVHPHSSYTLWHMTDPIIPFEVHRSPQTKQCKPLLSKAISFLTSKLPECVSREFNSVVWPFKRYRQKLYNVGYQGNWCMCKQCIPASLFSSPAQEPGNEVAGSYVCVFY